MGKAQELILTSRMIDAREAGEIGLVNYVVPADQLMEKTMEIADTIAALPPKAVRLNKQAHQLGRTSDIPSQLRYEELASVALRGTGDAAEAVAAFREKRDPVFTGR